MTTPGYTRRELLQRGLWGLGAGLGLSSIRVPDVWAKPLVAASADPEGPVLVVIELTGGNDGLNTIVPYRNDIYRQLRPTLALRKQDLHRVDDEFGFHPRLIGLRNLWREDKVAIVHGCGYPNPVRSHFSAMDTWHTASPHSGEPLGWVGRFADARWPEGRAGGVVNIGPRESLAVRSSENAPIVFDDPRTFVRIGSPDAQATYRQMIDPQGTEGEGGAPPSATLAYLRDIARNAEQSSQVVREAIASYRPSASYGSAVVNLGRDLRNVAALLRVDFPARVYYLSMPGFDTHSGQADHQANLLMYLGDALEGFMKDLEKLGRSREVAVLVFTEFGRRVAQNRSGGTDHGAATPMWLIGSGVRPGFHGRFPSLDDLDDGDQKLTTDFRRVYASVLDEWMGIGNAGGVIAGEHSPLGLFRNAPTSRSGA